MSYTIKTNSPRRIRRLSATLVADAPNVPEAMKRMFYSAMGTSAAMIDSHYNLTGMSNAVARVTNALLGQARSLGVAAAADRRPAQRKAMATEEEEAEEQEEQDLAAAHVLIQVHAANQRAAAAGGGGRGAVTAPDRQVFSPRDGGGGGGGAGGGKGQQPEGGRAVYTVPFIRMQRRGAKPLGQAFDELAAEEAEKKKKRRSVWPDDESSGDELEESEPTRPATMGGKRPRGVRSPSSEDDW